jgi:hypothetical protein
MNAMNQFTKFKRFFKESQVVRPPKHHLATFGSTSIEYILVTDVPGFTDRSRLRFGDVTTQKPAIIMPHTLSEKFEGFGDGANEYINWLVSQYGEALSGLEYQFKNNTTSHRIELSSPEETVRKLTREFDRSNPVRQALLRGPDKMWEITLLKFVIEETLASFSTNMQELSERGYFDKGAQAVHIQKRKIESLFKKARQDKSIINELGKTLKESHLFEEYQDRFFQLLK